MSSNRGNSNDADKTGDIISWVIIIILMFVLPPAGWILLLVKLGIFSNRKAKGSSNAGVRNINTSEKKSNRDMNNNIVIEQQKAKRNRRLDKKTGKGVSVLLFIVSIGLFIAGASMSIGALSSFLAGNPMAFAELGFGLFWLLSGLAAFLSRNFVAKRFSRYKNYYAYIGARDIVPIQAIVQIAGLSQKAVLRDLQAMINSGYLGSGAYIDNELECLVLSVEAADKLRADIMGADDTLPQTEVAPADQYAATLAELREVNAFINDESISKKVLHLEDLTEKIFKIVEESPEKQPQLKRFMSYYLPTTLKMVRSYATLEKQGVKGENILSTKKRIGDTLDTLSTGFEQQLDQLFKSDAIDIATDINVLENLMQQDGLAADKSEFRVATSSF